MKTYSERYVDLLKKYLSSSPEALSWVNLYGIYTHAVDDIIDGDRTDSKHILATAEMALMIFSHSFYHQNYHIFYSLCKTTHTAYADSVLLERSEDKIDRIIADPLRQFGNEVILAAIELVSGKDARDEAAPELRRLSYETHHDSEGNPV